MWCLCRLLPLMIGDKIPDSDARWINFLHLLKIIDLVFAPVLSDDHIAYLSTLIEDHHQDFTELYPSYNITPKLHYIIHYPQWISRYVLHCKLYLVYVINGFYWCLFIL